MARTSLDGERMTQHRLRNLVDTVVMLGGMGVLVLLLGHLLFGPGGARLALFALLALAVFSPRTAPWMMLRLSGARPLAPHELPGLHALVEDLSERSGLPRAPRLHYVPAPVMNAFSVGDRREAAVGITDGLLRRLSPRELAGVLAHEISHIAHRDLSVMSLAELMGRLTGSLSSVGQFLLLLNLPLVLAGAEHVSWLAIVLLLVAPQASALLQLALSRSREFDADLGAVSLTGDPAGLASALTRIERSQRGVLELLMPGRSPEPSLLRTHPATEARVRRLLEMGREEPARRPAAVSLEPGLFLMPEAWPVVARRARRWPFDPWR